MIQQIVSYGIAVVGFVVMFTTSLCVFLTSPRESDMTREESKREWFMALACGFLLIGYSIRLGS